MLKNKNKILLSERGWISTGNFKYLEKLMEDKNFLNIRETIKNSLQKFDLYFLYYSTDSKGEHK